MGCEHERLKSVNDHLYCMDCGEELPLEYLTGEQKQAKNPPADVQTGKPTARKTAAKMAAK